MATIGSFAAAVQKYTREKFRNEHPEPMLLHYWVERPLKPQSESASDTLNPLLMMDRSAGQEVAVPREEAYHVYPIRSMNPNATDLTIGSSSDCDVHVSDESISREHAVIEKRPNGYWIRDSGSASGSHLNGELVREDSPKRLTSGDAVQLGYLTFSFLTAGEFHAFVEGYFGL